MNNSATGGYVSPSSSQGFPKNLTFIQFLQTVLVGISGFPGELVRPSWQPRPPKMPDIGTDWMAFGVAESDFAGTPGFPFTGTVVVGDQLVYQSQRHEKVTLQCSIYGPAALDNYRLIRDGFYIGQNLEALVLANFGLVGVTKAIHLPELIDERWFNKYVFGVELNFEQVRDYPVLTFTSASGKLWAPTAVNNNNFVSWLVPAS